MNGGSIPEVETVPIMLHNGSHVRFARYTSKGIASLGHPRRDILSDDLHLALVREVLEAGFARSDGVKPDSQAFAITYDVLVIVLTREGRQHV
jgi:hypothetical protein